MIQAIMLIALGFLIASLIGVLLAPSLWSRASRLSKKRLEATLPLTLAEIEATQDQLRATYAVRVRRLESSLAGAKQKAANQLVDNSRLQMQIVALKDQIADLDLKLSERRNAATVLEQTITKRFPELDREITAVKAQLQERSYELQNLTSKLARREEELAGTQEAAASYQEELQRLHLVLERSAADRSGRRVRRASQWDLEDYRAEYDRLNLELSKLRQQLTAFQDRDSQQVGVIKGELQKLAELILTSAQSKGASPEPERPELSAKRFGGQESRRERPIPWRQNAQAPIPLAARLKHNAGTPATEQIPVTNSLLAPPAPDRPPDSAAPSGAPSLASPVLTILPEETVLTSAPKNGHGDVGGRPKILQEVVTANEPEHAEDITKPSESEETKPESLDKNCSDAREEVASDSRASMAKSAPAGTEEIVAMTPAPGADGVSGQERRHASSDDLKAVPGAGSTEAAAGNGVDHTPYQNGEAEEANLPDVLNLESLSSDPDDEKIGPHLPTLLERLRSIGEDHGEGEKPLPPSRGLG
jgi:hypothetical protein